MKKGIDIRRQRLLFMFFAVAVLLLCYCGLSYAFALPDTVQTFSVAQASATSGNNIQVCSACANTTIQSGYNAAVNGATIQVQAGTYVENDIFNSNVSVALTGGYDSSFSTNSLYSSIGGTLIISAGTVTAQNIIIKNPPTLVSIAVTPATPSITLGTTEQFTATGTYSDNSTENLTTSATWSSSDVSVATISNTSGSDGKASSKAAGTTTITATLGSIAGHTTLTVNPATLVSIAVTPANPSVAVGVPEQFTATGTYSDNSTQNLTASATWTSSNVSVATISNVGLANPVAAGTTTITATSGTIPGSTVLTVTVASGTANVLTLTVNGSTCDSTINAGYTNDPCVSVKVCNPNNTSNCVTINGILLDTGSFGLRIFKEKLGSVSLTQVASGSGSGSLAECAQFGDGTSLWGPVQTASLVLGNEPTMQVPIQVVDSTFGSVPSSCKSPNANLLTNPSIAGFNGILGVGPLVQDCGAICVSSITNPGLYYTCSGSRCSETTVPLSNQVANPVALLPTDNAGLIVELPIVAASGAASVNGSLVLGIGTNTNNTPSGVTTYPVDGNNEFTTIFNNVSYADGTNAGGSFIDTGSNALYFPASQLADCGGTYAGWYCPSVTTPLSATITGASGSPSGTVQFQIGNFINLTANPSNMVFDNIGGYFGGGGFDWGLPFYFGKQVYIGFEGKTSSLGTGPYFAY